MLAEGSLAFFIVIIVLGVFALGIISIIGQVYLTKLSFNVKSTGNQRTIEMKDWELHFSRVTVVLNWIILGLMTVGGILEAIVVARK